MELLTSRLFLKAVLGKVSTLVLFNGQPSLELSSSYNYTVVEQATSAYSATRFAKQNREERLSYVKVYTDTYGFSP